MLPVKPTSTPLLIACSLLAGCQSFPGETVALRDDALRDDALCSLRSITISDAVREQLRQPLASDTPPEGYDRFLRDLAAHNAKIRAHCGPLDAGR